MYVYAVLCTPALQDAGPTIAAANHSQVTLEVHRLRPLTEYQCQVVALLIHRNTGDIKMQGSEKVTISTLEGGNLLVIIMHCDAKELILLVVSVVQRKDVVINW